jgi:hypothetical protein
VPLALAIMAIVIIVLTPVIVIAALLR